METITYKITQDQLLAPIDRDQNVIFPVYNPILLAHDLVEHLNGYDFIGEIGDEFMAVGACLIGRYSYLEFCDEQYEFGLRKHRQWYSNDDAVFRDVYTLADDFIIYDKDFETELPEFDDTDYHDYDDLLNVAFATALMEVNPDDQEERDRHQEFFKDDAHIAKQYIRYGMYLAEKNYGSGLNLYYMYADVRDKAVDLFEHVKYGFEGQRFSLKLDRENRTFDFTFDDEDEFYE